MAPPIALAEAQETRQQPTGVVVSATFAGTLRHLLGAVPCSLHLCGDSSGGKTPTASVDGGPRMLRTWHSTDNTLEGTAAAHSDGLPVLDEIHQCEASVISDTVYMLGNGKTRANDRGNVTKHAYSWRLLFLSTGEKALARSRQRPGAVRGVLGCHDEFIRTAPAEQLPDPFAPSGRLYGSPVQALNPDGSVTIKRPALTVHNSNSAHAAQRLQAWQGSYLALLVGIDQLPGAMTDGFLPKATSHGWLKPARSGQWPYH